MLIKPAISKDALLEKMLDLLVVIIINYTATKNLSGLAAFLDVEKAFDSIEWNFLFKVLNLFNFGPDFKNWVQTF